MIGVLIGERVVRFIDDLNMPMFDRCGARPPIGLLRQIRNFRGLCDRDELFWERVLGVEINAACAPPGGRRNAVTPRLTRHSSVFCLSAPSELMDGLAADQH